MLAVSEAMKSFLFGHQEKTPFVRIVFKNNQAPPDGVGPVRGLMSYDLDVSEFVSRFGSIRRSLSYDIGRFRPGGHSFTLENTKDMGDYLFTLRKRFGLEFWQDKTYEIFFGFKEIPIVSSVGDALPLIATWGFGDTPANSFANSTTGGWGTTPSGQVTLESAREELINIYTGEIYSKREDRLNEKVFVASKDILKQVSDFKVCTIIQASTVFDYEVTTTDERGMQQFIKYGTHKLILNGEGKEKTNRRDPFSCTLGQFNLASARRTGTVGGYIDRMHLWYFPFQNEIESELISSNYSGGNLKLYYWDYRDSEKKWVAFNASNFSAKVDVKSPATGSVLGVYAEILNDNPDGFPDSWTNYINGQGGTWNPDSDPNRNDDLDPMLLFESEDALIDQNPVRVIYDLLKSNRYIDFDETPDSGQIDASTTDFSQTNPDIIAQYSFDESFQFFDNEEALINTSYVKEVSLLKIIENVSLLCNLQFFTNAKKNESEDRRIHLVTNKIVSPCADKPPVLLELSTAGRLRKYEIETSSDTIKDKVLNTNFNSSISTKETFDTVIEGTGDRTIQLGTPSNPPVYFYNSRNAVISIAQRLLSWLSKPVEILDTILDASGLMIELADYLEAHEHKTNEKIIFQIYNWGFNLHDKIDFKARRYTDLYGPEEINPFKKWAFVDCAYVDNDGTGKTGRSGADASVPLADNEVTLGGGETIDSELAKLKMEVTLDGNSLADAEHFRLESIADITHFDLDANAAIAHVNDIWSIGVSYHAY